MLRWSRMQEPAEAVKGTGRAASKNWASSASPSLGTPPDRNLDHPDFYPFYAKAEELGVPVCVHVGSGRPAAAAERFDNPFFVHATTHAFEQMIGVMCIVGGGILERYPKVESGVSGSRRRLGALLDGALGRAL